MIKYLQNYGNYTSTGLTKEEKKELEKLRNEVQKYRDFEFHTSQSNFAKFKKKVEEEEQEPSEEESNSSESGSDNEEQQDDEADEKEFQAKIKKRQEEKKGVKRAGVSAEAYGKYNKKENFNPPVIEKSDEQKLKIKNRILTSFLFTTLDPKDLDIVINAMDVKKYNKDEYVIKQGDKGDLLYVVEQGEVNCTKLFPGDTKEKFLKKYYPGESFGELALLYNAPRAANLITATECVFFVLDRETFNIIVKDAAQKKRQKYENFLKNVDILSTIDSYELMQISDAIKSETYQKGDYIIKEGEIGDIFYILEEGSCIATKTLEPGKPAIEIKTYKPGEYFGERALIKGAPRYANIISNTEYCKVISLERATFNRLLGPIQPLLRRNMEKYTKFVEEDKE